MAVTLSCNVCLLLALPPETKEFELSTTRMIEHYKKCTGLDEEKIRQHLLPPEDVWLSAKEAKKLNLCDGVKNVY